MISRDWVLLYLITVSGSRIKIFTCYSQFDKRIGNTMAIYVLIPTKFFLLFFPYIHQVQIFPNSSIFSKACIFLDEETNHSKADVYLVKKITQLIKFSMFNHAGLYCFYETNHNFLKLT